MTEPSFAIASHIDTVTEVVRRAGDRSLRWYRNLDQVDNKWDNKWEVGFDPVTEADRVVETELRNELASRFPGHQIVGEEFGTSGEGPYRWTIDPIDGTRAFITGQPMWGTLLGFQDHGRPVAGWMHVPVLGETYVGHQTCRLRTAEGERAVTVGPTERLEDAVVLSTDPAMFAPGREAEGFARVVEAARLVRYAGDCLNYGLLAMGLADAVVENGLAPYDIVPLIPIVESAGGVVTDLDGEQPVDGGFVVAAATPTLQQEILDVLAGGS